MTATVTLSVELELGWGVVHHQGLDALSDGRQRETETLSDLLSICDDFDVPITFDVVGHLFLEEPLPAYDGPHPEGWLDPIPETGPEVDPEFYAPNLIEMIRSADVDHEICTHTFTHVECGEVSRETLDWELQRVREVHDERGIAQPTSFVPPRHSLPPYATLREHGIEIVRVPRHCASDGGSRPTKMSRALDIVTGSQPVCPPAVRDGLVETYTTERISLSTPLFPSGQSPPHPVFRLLPVSVRRRLHRRNLRRAVALAVDRESFVHLWSHLWDVANEYQWPQVADFLVDLGKRQRAGAVSVRTMRALNRSVRER